MGPALPCGGAGLLLMAGTNCTAGPGDCVTVEAGSVGIVCDAAGMTGRGKVALWVALMGLGNAAG
jgi:hypothetical protein